MKIKYAFVRSSCGDCHFIRFKNAEYMVHFNKFGYWFLRLSFRRTSNMHGSGWEIELPTLSVQMDKVNNVLDD